MQLQIVNYIAATSSGGIVQTIAVVVSIILQRQRLRDNRGGVNVFPVRSPCVLTCNERVCVWLPGTMDGDDFRFEFFGG